MIRWLDTCRSTNAEAAAGAASLDHGDVIATREQTAGRGQRGNSWEAEPGRNLTFSMLLRPTALLPSRQFEISMAVSLAIVGVLDRHLPVGMKAKIKWPNDIYVGDRKICGILIEHSLLGTSIEHTVVGVGVNVNQLRFESDAPNPVSLVQLLGRETPLEPLLEEFAGAMVGMADSYDAVRLRSAYFAALYRGDGCYQYVDAATGIRFDAEIADVAADGILTLRLRDGECRRYAFKEVIFG